MHVYSKRQSDEGAVTDLFPSGCRMGCIKIHKSACQLAEASQSLYDVNVAVTFACLRATSLHRVLCKSLRNRAQAEPGCATVLHGTVMCWTDGMGRIWPSVRSLSFADSCFTNGTDFPLHA